MQKLVFFEILHFFHQFMVLSHFFEVKFRPHPNRIFMVFKRLMNHSKTILLRGVLCKNVYFLRY